MQLLGSFGTAGTDVVTKRQSIIYCEAKSFNGSFRYKSGIHVQFRFNVCEIGWQSHHKLEFFWIGFHTIFIEPINSNLIIKAQVWQNSF